MNIAQVHVVINVPASKRHCQGNLNWLEIKSARLIEEISADNRVQVVCYMLSAFALVVPCFSVARRLCDRLAISPLFIFGTMLLVLGAFAEAIFFLTMVSRTLAVGFAWASALTGCIYTLRDLQRPDVRRLVVDSDCWLPFSATAVAGITYLALFLLELSPNVSVPGAVMAWFRLPTDNFLPHWLALHVEGHLPPKPFIADWLSSDRPPLQAGFDLLFSALVPSNSDSEARYQAVSTLLQATSLGMLFVLARLAGCRTLRAIGVVALAYTCGFFFLNSLFVWPKLIAAAFAAVAVAIFMAPGALSDARAIAIGCSSAFAALSHTAVAFTFPALLAVWIYSERRGALRHLPLALAAFLVLNLPWNWYQHWYDPPADRLLKWFLSGRVAVTSQAFFPSFLQAYTSVPLPSIVSYKIANLATTLGVNTTRMAAYGWYARQFFVVRYALCALLVPYIAALFFISSRRRQLRLAAIFAWISLASTVCWAFALYIPGTTVVHVGSYLTMLLMFAAGAIVATEWPVVFIIVFTAQITIFATTWLTLVPWTKLSGAGGLLSAAIMLVVACAATLAAWKPLVNGLRELQRGMPTFAAAKRYLRTHATPLCGLAVLALVAPLTTSLAPRYTYVVASWSELPAEPFAPSTAAIPLSEPVTSPTGGSKRQPGEPLFGVRVPQVEGHPAVQAGPVSEHKIAVIGSEVLRVSGWAADPVQQDAAAAVIVQIGSRAFAAHYGEPRPDVAAAFAHAQLTDVGFTARIGCSDIALGSDPLRIIVISSDGKSYYTAASKFVIVRI